jgi:adenylylsulfate kinase-like enzyme
MSKIKVLIFGLPGSGKTTFAKKLCKNKDYAYFNGDTVRNMFNEKNFQEKDRLEQAIRMEKLCNMTYKNCIVDFVCPYNKTRTFYDITVFMDTVDKSKYKNTNKIFQKPFKCDFHIKNYKYNKIIKKIHGLL